MVATFWEILTIHRNWFHNYCLNISYCSLKVRWLVATGFFCVNKMYLLFTMLSSSIEPWSLLATSRCSEEVRPWAYHLSIGRSVIYLSLNRVWPWRPIMSRSPYIRTIKEIVLVILRSWLTWMPWSLLKRVQILWSIKRHALIVLHSWGTVGRAKVLRSCVLSKTGLKIWSLRMKKTKNILRTWLN